MNIAHYLLLSLWIIWWMIQILSLCSLQQQNFYLHLFLLYVESAILCSLSGAVLCNDESCNKRWLIFSLPPLSQCLGSVTSVFCNYQVLPPLLCCCRHNNVNCAAAAWVRPPIPRRHHDNNRRRLIILLLGWCFLLACWFSFYDDY